MCQCKMIIFYFNLCTIIVLARAKTLVSLAQSKRIIEDENQYCICVPYWQCKEDYNGLIKDELGIVNSRFRSNEECTGDFDVCCQIKCGKRSTFNRKLTYETLFSSQILGNNNDAGFAEFPWMLGLVEDNIYRCGASLIHPQVALTAAHCITPNRELYLRAGEWNWDQRTEPLPHQDRLVENVIFHPLYAPEFLINDIALLILNAPFKLTENVGLICLPHHNSQLSQKKCIATGWGTNSFTDLHYQPILKKVEMPIVPSRACQRSLQDILGPFYSLHESFICAGGEANKDTCQGDGGSPLICLIDGQSGRYEQVGIVSWGVSCGVANIPGVYVNVALFRDWIGATMKLLNFDTNIYT